MDGCVFCSIVSKKIPATTTYEDERVVAFLDIHPKAPGHTLLIPKEHYPWFIDIPDDLADHWFKMARTLAKKLKVEHNADYVQLSIVGKDVPHAHLHLIPRTLTDTSVPA